MDDVAIARAIHVLAVVWWIGGVAIVTTVILPGARRLGRGVAEFEQAERRFALQARVATVLAGISGFYMVVRFDLWGRFMLVEYWWMTREPDLADFELEQRHAEPAARPQT